MVGRIECLPHVKTALENNMNPNVATRKPRETPIMKAINVGCVETIKVLATYNVKIDTSNYYLHRLMFSLLSHNSQLFATLIAHNLAEKIINIVDLNGWSILDAACVFIRDENCIKLLLFAKAFINLDHIISIATIYFRSIPVPILTLLQNGLTSEDKIWCEKEIYKAGLIEPTSMDFCLKRHEERRQPVIDALTGPNANPQFPLAGGHIALFDLITEYASVASHWAMESTERRKRIRLRETLIEIDEE
jgi:ankyrin repeat protein